jgi:hypothetical protein
MYVRIDNPPLVNALQQMEILGTMSLAAFARKGQTSEDQPESVASDYEPPTSDATIPADELEEIGTLAQMRGISWSKIEGGTDVVCM